MTTAIIGNTTPVSAVLGPGSVPGPAQVGALIALRWDGTTYQPIAQASQTMNPKFFVGPTDPSNVQGVVMSTYDQWIQTV